MKGNKQTNTHFLGMLLRCVHPPLTPLLSSKASFESKEIRVRTKKNLKSEQQEISIYYYKLKFVGVFRVYAIHFFVQLCCFMRNRWEKEGNNERSCPVYLCLMI
jgi:hypothetical protein